MTGTWISEKNVVDLVHAALSAMPRVRSQFRALNYKEVPQAFKIIEASGASLSVRLCLMFTILKTTRSSKSRGAAWSEIDPNLHEWKIPASRMKTNTKH